MTHRKHLWLLPVIIVLGVMIFFFFLLPEPSEDTPADHPAKIAARETLPPAFEGAAKNDTAPLNEDAKAWERTPSGEDIKTQNALTQDGVVLGEDADVWEVWGDEQAEALFAFALSDFYKRMPGAQKLEPSQLEKMKASFRAQIAEQAALLRKQGAAPPPVSSNFELTKVEYHAPERYTGPQTVSALMERFDESYSRRRADTVVDAKYPRDEWLSMLREQGITIETNEDYWRYLDIRHDLVRLEDDPEAWDAEGTGIPPTDSWNTYESAYMDRKIWEVQQIQKAQRADPMIIGGWFGGPDRKTFMPTTRHSLYVKRDGMGASFLGGHLSETEKFNLIFRGIEPEWHDVIYLDADDNVLSDPPPPITREEFLKAAGPPPPGTQWEEDFKELFEEELFESDFQSEFSAPEASEHPSASVLSSHREVERTVQEQVDQAHKRTEQLLEFFRRSDAEVQSALENGFLPAVPSEEDFEEALGQQFSGVRFDRAVNILNQYGPEVGLRKLHESDPELARDIERRLKDPK